MKKVVCLSLFFILGIRHLAIADEVDDFLKAAMAEHEIPGAAVCILKDGKVVKNSAYGFANLEWNIAATPDTVFEIGSVTKQFTAACILLLQQDGKLSLDDRITNHLPAAPAIWSEVTIRHLLTHTSGVKSYTGLNGFELTKRLKQDEFIIAIGRHPLEFTPGESWKYSNSGYSLLGYIVENVSGQDYWSFLRQRIFQPLGMNATTDRNPFNIVTNRADGYERRNRRFVNRDYDLTDVFSAGAIVSRTADLAKWAQSLDSGSLLTAETKAEMWTDQPLADGKKCGYGLGWHIDEFEGHQNIGHGGSTSGFSASLQRFPGDKLTVILLTNTGEQIASKLAKKIAGFYFH